MRENNVSANIRVPILTANISKIQVDFGVLLNLFTKVENIILIRGRTYPRILLQSLVDLTTYFEHTFHFSDQ